MIRDHDSLKNDKDTIARAMRVREMMNGVIRNTSAQERDRRMQVHLAQARGPVANAALLRSSIALMLRMKGAQVQSENLHG